MKKIIIIMTVLIGIGTSAKAQYTTFFEKTKNDTTVHVMTTYPYLDDQEERSISLIERNGKYLFSYSNCRAIDESDAISKGYIDGYDFYMNETGVMKLIDEDGEEYTFHAVEHKRSIHFTFTADKEEFQKLREKRIVLIKIYNEKIFDGATLVQINKYRTYELGNLVYAMDKAQKMIRERTIPINDKRKIKINIFE